MSLGASGDIVASRLANKQLACEKMVTSSVGINTALESLSSALDPVRQTWYASGSASGTQAEFSERKLREALHGIAGILDRLGCAVRDSGNLAAGVDRGLAERCFAPGGQQQALNTSMTLPTYA